MEFRLACEVDFGDERALLDERRVQTLVAAALFEAGLERGDVEVGVTFCDSARIAQLNAEHRGIDAATDVLSFPIDGLDEPVPPGMPRAVGDVVICVDYVRAQLADGTTMQGDDSLAAAVERCVVHGTLHLAGFDHERSDADATEMFALEQLVLDRVHGLGIRDGA